MLLALQPRTGDHLSRPHVAPLAVASSSGSTAAQQPPYQGPIARLAPGKTITADRSAIDKLEGKLERAMKSDRWLGGISIVVCYTTLLNADRPIGGGVLINKCTDDIALCFKITKSKFCLKFHPL